MGGGLSNIEVGLMQFIDRKSAISEPVFMDVYDTVEQLAVQRFESEQETFNAGMSALDKHNDTVESLGLNGAYVGIGAVKFMQDDLQANAYGGGWILQPIEKTPEPGEDVVTMSGPFAGFTIHPEEMDDGWRPNVAYSIFTGKTRLANSKIELFASALIGATSDGETSVTEIVFDNDLQLASMQDALQKLTGRNVKGEQLDYVLDRNYLAQLLDGLSKPLSERFERPNIKDIAVFAAILANDPAIPPEQRKIVTTSLSQLMSAGLRLGTENFFSLYATRIVDIDVFRLNDEINLLFTALDGKIKTTGKIEDIVFEAEVSPVDHKGTTTASDRLVAPYLRIRNLFDKDDNELPVSQQKLRYVPLGRVVSLELNQLVVTT